MKPKKTAKDSAKIVRVPLAKSASGAHPARGKHVRRDRRQRAKKGPWSGGGPPFGREFFADTLGSMVQGCPCADGHAPIVSVHLGDGSVLDLAGVVSLFERYAVVATFEGKGDDGIERTKDDIGFEAFPYDLVVRTSVRTAPAQSRRFGFGGFAAGGGHGKPAADGAPPPTA